MNLTIFGPCHLARCWPDRARIWPEAGQILTRSYQKNSQILASCGQHLVRLGQDLARIWQDFGNVLPSSITYHDMNPNNLPRIWPASRQIVPESGQILTRSCRMLACFGQILPESGQIPARSWHNSVLFLLRFRVFISLHSSTLAVAV